MSEQTIAERVKEILVNQLNVNDEQIVPTASLLDDLGADSLDVIELVMTFEEEFRTELGREGLPDSTWGAAKTVGDIVALIERTAAGK